MKRLYIVMTRGTLNSLRALLWVLLASGIVNSGADAGMGTHEVCQARNQTKATSRRCESIERELASVRSGPVKGNAE